MTTREYDMDTNAFRGAMKRLRALGCALCLALASGCVTAPISAPAKLGEKTVLFYEAAHGNQVEYYDPSGRSFLWYPNNKVVVAGRWEARGKNICFIYGENTYNPVSGSRGDSWRCTGFATWSKSIVDVEPGDGFRLSTSEAPPYRLPARRRFGSLSEVRSAPPP